MALGAERCVAHDLEVSVVHPERCEDRLQWSSKVRYGFVSARVVLSSGYSSSS
jgi:hypothetical protein